MSLFGEVIQQALSSLASLESFYLSANGIMIIFFNDVYDSAIRPIKPSQWTFAMKDSDVLIHHDTEEIIDIIHHAQKNFGFKPIY